MSANVDSTSECASESERQMSFINRLTGICGEFYKHNPVRFSVLILLIRHCSLIMVKA